MDNRLIFLYHQCGVMGGHRRVGQPENGSSGAELVGRGSLQENPQKELEELYAVPKGPEVTEPMLSRKTSKC